MTGLQSAILCVLVCTLLCIGWCESRVSDELRVVLPHGGGVTGKYMTSHRGRGIRAFLGIPFAEPPLGSLRFTDPMPKLPWTDDIPATDGKTICPQTMGTSIVGTEDCLYVNVYAPLNPTTPGPLPVMFFIHGGGFVAGSGSADLYAPDYLLDHDVILVAGNYRLGALGFMSIGTSEMPGNYGLKDQLLLLQWLQDNIASFNGDPRQVTIFGESAGAASVGFHLISKSSYKLFDKAILQSGTQYAPWAFDSLDENPKNAAALAEGLGCPSPVDGFHAFSKCFREKTPEEIIGKELEVLDPLSIPFRPTVEASAEGFIQKRPQSYTRSMGLDIPIMIGVNKDEGAFMTALMMTLYNNDFSGMNEEHLDRQIESSITTPGLDDEEMRRIQELAKDFYFKTGRFERAHVNNVTDFFSDGFFMSPTDEFLLNRLVKNGKSANTFVYLFAHGGAVSTLDLFPALGMPKVDLDQDLGVSHFDDVIYLFPLGERFVSHLVPTKADALTQSLLTEMWVNFATNGQPSSRVAPDVTWSAASGYPLDFLRIGNHDQPEKDFLGMEQGLLEERLNLWRQLKSIQVDGGQEDAALARDEL